MNVMDKMSMQVKCAWAIFENNCKDSGNIDIDLTNCVVSIFQNTNVDDGGGFISDLPLLKRECKLLSF